MEGLISIESYRLNGLLDVYIGHMGIQKNTIFGSSKIFPK